MIIVAENKKNHYELANIAQIFFPNETITPVERLEQPPAEAETLVRTFSVEEGDRLCNRVEIRFGDGQELSGEEMSENNQHDSALSMGRVLYQLFVKRTGRQMDWGVLTGIRPVKVARVLRKQGKTPQEIQEIFCNQYLTRPEKARLCIDTDRNQAQVIDSALPHGYSLYLSIPFCPSRCSYCSFVSHSIEKTWKLIPDYLEKMLVELRQTARIAREKGLRLQTVYMGGGTPTVLTAEQLERVLSAVREEFDFSDCTEFTVEGGRPDTITEAKLDALRRCGVDRISINTQTTNDHILEAIGRKHTAQEFFDKFALAKTKGFHAINVDLIAGLPGEDEASFCRSLDQVIGLGAENITVHSLTVKRAARLAEEKKQLLPAGERQAQATPVSRMIDYSQQALRAAGYEPYYLYRQKNTIDCLENVGYSKPGTACQYNIFIMDETHTILSVGGGGVTKMVMPGAAGAESWDNVRIERIFNLKYPYEYISRFDTILERKQKILEYPL